MDGQRNPDGDNRSRRHFILHPPGRAFTGDVSLNFSELDNLHPKCERPHHCQDNGHIDRPLDGNQLGNCHSGRHCDSNRIQRDYGYCDNYFNHNHLPHVYDNSTGNLDHYSDVDTDGDISHNGDYYVYHLRGLLKGPS